MKGPPDLTPDDRAILAAAPDDRARPLPAFTACQKLQGDPDEAGATASAGADAAAKAARRAELSCEKVAQVKFDGPALAGLDPGTPVSDRGSGLLADFELDRPACLLLNDRGAVPHPTAGANIFDL